MRRPEVNPHARRPGAEPLWPEPLLEPATVLALIVTYHPDAGVGDRMRPLLGTVGAILFVDNGSRPDEIEPLEPLLGVDGVHLLQNARNVGLATALNQGFRVAREHGFLWVLTVDQDTVPSAALVPAAAYVLASHRERRIALVGAAFGDQANGRSSPEGDEVTWVITSGALQSVNAWQHVGGFREDFFIDHVDVEFCLRARAMGYSVFRASTITIRHSIGSPTAHRTLLGSFSPSNHSRERRYYITRNRVIVWRAYTCSEPRYVVHDVKAAARELAKVVLFEDDRRRKVIAMIRGMRDGIRGSTGEAEWM